MRPSSRLRTIVISSAALLAGGLFTAAPAAADTEFPTYGSGVNVRADASTSSDVVGSLSDGESISVDCQKEGDSVTVDGNTSSWWAHVPSKDGYVTVVYVDIEESKLPDIPECGGGEEPPPSDGDITYDDLTTMFPGKVGDQATVEKGLPSLNAEMAKGEINTPARKAAFLATLANESTLRYDADQGTGETYTGRGFIQLTGEANYTSAGEYFDIDLLGDPALAKSLDHSAPIARWYWTVARDINPLADDLDMGGVDAAIGYATDPDEDVERCDDFKAALKHLNGSVPDGVNCNRPAVAGSSSKNGTQDQSPKQFKSRMGELLKHTR